MTFICLWTTQQICSIILIRVNKNRNMMLEKDHGLWTGWMAWTFWSLAIIKRAETRGIQSIYHKDVSKTKIFKYLGFYTYDWRIYKCQLLSRYFKPTLPCGMSAIEKNCPFFPLKQLEIRLGIYTYICVRVHI